MISVPVAHWLLRESDTVIDTANRFIDYFQRHQRPIIASKDWHPADHLTVKKFVGTVVGEITIKWPPNKFGASALCTKK